MSVKLHRLFAGRITEVRLNRTLHGRSKFRIKDVPGHNVVKGNSKPGHGDGLDCFLPVGTEITATHTGEITYVGDTKEKLSAMYLEGVQNGHEITTVYAHLKYKPDLKAGRHIIAGQVVGWVDRKLKDPHLHVEIWIDDQALAESTAAKLAARIGSYFVE